VLSVAAIASRIPSADQTSVHLVQGDAMAWVREPCARVTKKEKQLANSALSPLARFKAHRTPPLTLQSNVDKIYQLLKDTTDVLNKHGLKWWAEGGTLLGAVRSKGLIKWDDDADIGMDIADETKFRRTIPDYEKVGIRVTKWYYGYKIYYKNGKPIPGKTQFKFPFIDLFLVDWEGNRDAKNTAECGRSYFPRSNLWPHCYFTGDELYPLASCKFGPLSLYCARYPDKYLDRCYGAQGDWRKVGFRGKDHETYRGPDMGSVESLTNDMMSPALPSGPLNDNVRSS